MEKQRQHVDVALCFNDAYLKHIGPLIYALSSNNADLDFSVHVVYKNLSEQSLQALSTMETFFPNITFDFRYIESELINHISVEHSDFPLETYFRLVLADVLYDVDRLLYFDVDLLISGSIKGLWELDLNGSCIAGAIEKDNYMYFRGYTDWLGLTEKHGYFSAGVLLFDLKQMRERNLPEILVNLAIEKAEILRFCDQDLLNIYFKDEVIHFDERYNYSSWQMFNESKGPDDVSITHFNGLQKPWGIITEHRGEQWKFVARYREYRRAYHHLLHPEEDLVTVLVDARQSKTYMTECLESIFSQTYQNLEILVIVDPGDSEILTKLMVYQQYESRIKIISSDGSHDSVLSLGISYSNRIGGDYVTGVYSSDFLPSYCIETMLDVYQEYQTDVIIGDYYILDASQGMFHIRHTNTGNRRLLSPKEALLNQTERHLGTMSGKLFTKSFLENISLTYEEKNFELNLLRRLYLDSKEIAYVETHLFCYRSNVDLENTLPTTVSSYEAKIRAVHKAILDNQVLNLETGSLKSLLIDLLEGVQILQLESKERLSESLLSQLRLLTAIN